MRAWLFAHRVIVVFGTAILALFIGAGALTVARVSDQVTKDANDRLARHAAAEASTLQDLMVSASSDSLSLSRANSRVVSCIR